MKLDRVGLVDNRPSIDKLYQFVKKKKKKKTRDMWHVTCDTWHMTHDTWHVTCDMLWGVNILSKFQLPSSFGVGVSQIWALWGICVVLKKSSSSFSRRWPHTQEGRLEGGGGVDRDFDKVQPEGDFLPGWLPIALGHWGKIIERGETFNAVTLFLVYPLQTIICATPESKGVHSQGSVSLKASWMDY